MDNHLYSKSKTVMEPTNKIPKRKINNFRCVMGWLCCPMGSTIYLLRDIRNTMIRNEAEKKYDIQRNELLNMINLEDEKEQNPNPFAISN
jgi:hypothetical protein